MRRINKTNTKKKALIVCTVVGFVATFEKNDINILQELGYEVHCACNCEEFISEEDVEDLWRQRVIKHHIPFDRNPFSRNNISSYRLLKRVITKGGFDIIHCHTPVGGVLGRLAAHKCNVPYVLYTAHGFHFFKGAPLENWLLFYPIEWICSWWTDVLITITKEDYRRAKRRLHAKKTTYVPGVGIDTKKFAPNKTGRERIRKELGLKDEQIMILSVGELNDNKNHISVIRALKDSNYVYVIVGKGDKKRELEQVAATYNVDLRFMGYREDVADIYNAADVYVLPSKREGLNVSLMEAMASGLPVACSDIRGNNDLIKQDEVLFNPYKLEDIKRAIIVALEYKDSFGNGNKKRVNKYSIKMVNEKMFKIYKECKREFI